MNLKQLIYLFRQLRHNLIKDNLRIYYNPIKSDPIQNKIKDAQSRQYESRIFGCKSPEGTREKDEVLQQHRKQTISEMV